MSLWEKFTRSNFLIKLKSWEYWPFGILQFPIFFYWMWLSLRSKSILFFSGSNPGITMGGMFGESKYDVLTKIPAEFIPKSILISLPASKKDLIDKMKAEGILFPVIFKPDIGERGFMVKRIGNEDEIDPYLQKIKGAFLVQELVDLPMEFGVFYSRLPGEKKGSVTSVVMKEMLTVTGDGKSTLQQLILSKDRAKLQWETLSKTFEGRLAEIVPAGKTIELVSIGNHCLGTMFLDGSHLINEQMSESFDRLSKQIEGFYFGRFDLRCQTVKHLVEGKVKILELNGCGAEPAHIYQPGYSFFKAVNVLLVHWRTIFLIARETKKQGIPFVTLKDGLAYYRKFKSATATV